MVNGGNSFSLKKAQWTLNHIQMPYKCKCNTLLGLRWNLVGFGILCDQIQTLALAVTWKAVEIILGFFRHINWAQVWWECSGCKLNWYSYCSPTCHFPTHPLLPLSPQSVSIPRPMDYQPKLYYLTTCIHLYTHLAWQQAQLWGLYNRCHCPFNCMSAMGLELLSMPRSKLIYWYAWEFNLFAIGCMWLNYTCQLSCYFPMQKLYSISNQNTSVGQHSVCGWYQGCHHYGGPMCAIGPLQQLQLDSHPYSNSLNITQNGCNSRRSTEGCCPIQ